MDEDQQETQSTDFTAVEVSDNHTKSTKKPKFAYVCNLCGREFNQKHRIKAHLSSKTLCHERRTVDWLAHEIKNSGSIISIMNKIDDDIISFKVQCSKVTSVEEIKECQRALKRLITSFNKLKANVRIVCTNMGDPYKHDNDLNEYDKKIKMLKDQYLLLLI